MKQMITLLLCAGFYWASGQNDPSATALLDKAYARYEKASTIEARFAMVIDLPEQGTETQSGVMRQKGDRYMIDGSAYAVYNDGKTMTVHMKDAAEVQITSAEDEEEGIPSMDDILGLYKSGEFEYQRLPDEGSNASIEFKPLDRDSEYSKLRMTLNNKTGIPSEMVFFNKDGSKYTISLENITWDTPIGDEVFEFDASKYPDVYIEDLRID